MKLYQSTNGEGDQSLETTVRQIRFAGEGSEMRQPSSLPFIPPGLRAV